MTKIESKREVPSVLRKILAVDAYLTDEFVKKTEKILPLRQLKVHYKLLEVSAHAIPWLAGWLAFIWILNSKELYQMQVNLFLGKKKFIPLYSTVPKRTEVVQTNEQNRDTSTFRGELRRTGLLVDIFLVAVIKAVTRRRRPAKNDDPFELGPDKYSFPSGHASRATYITFFFLKLWPVSFVFAPPFLAWTVSVCISRLLMRRHHILDVLAGIILGIFNGFFIGMTYLEADTCLGIISWLTDEKLDGGEYHV